ncbi:MAG TPA: ABC transporter permease [Actinoplanes sp.]|jgi:ABC-2 type transport system permease protein
MTTMAYAVRDTRTMLRRNLRRMRRYPAMTMTLIGMPVVFLLLFVFVLGGTLGAGLTAGGGRAQYADYVTPGILLLSIASGAAGTATTMAMDITEGIIARFKTMAIFRPSVLTGHVAANVLQTVFGVIVLLGVGLAVGFRPTAGPLEWLAAAGLVLGVTIAITWLAVASGLAARSVETASNWPLLLLLLPFLGSGFVPTDSMPAGLRWFAEYQPFTPMMETLRGLLLGAGIGHNGWLALAWCLLLTAVGYVWARKLYNRDPR